MPVDYHVHAVGHHERVHSLEELNRFANHAKKVGLREIGFADHDWCLDIIDLNLYQLLKEQNPELQIRVGLEFEYFPGQHERIQSLINSYPFDYTIGAVHFLGTWNFDHPEQMMEYDNWSTLHFYEEYYNTLLQCVQSGLFSIAAHLDLAKVFNHRINPKKSMELVMPVLEAIKAKEMVVELNPAGLYKPVSELYPSMEIIQEAARLDIPFTLASDAHRWQDVGRNQKLMVDILQGCGVNYVMGFNQLKKYSIPLRQ